MPSGQDHVPPPGVHPPSDRRISFLQHAACCRGGGLHATYRPALPGRPCFTGEVALQHPTAHRIIISAPGNSSGFRKNSHLHRFVAWFQGGAGAASVATLLTLPRYFRRFSHHPSFAARCLSVFMPTPRFSAGERRPTDPAIYSSHNHYIRKAHAFSMALPGFFKENRGVM